MEHITDTHSPTTLPRKVPLAARRHIRLNTDAIQNLGLLLLISAIVWIGMSQLSTPEVTPASASQQEFSAERAMEHLRVIAAEPRAAGSPGHEAARDYLVEQLRSMGLEPQVQTATVVVPGEAGQSGFSVGVVHNVIARIPGTDNTGAIAIDAHYDSGPTGPGAMDAGAGVVATLESVRALLSGPAIRNDVIIVFADGEELGMLGAHAFNQQHPWAEDVRLALNFEGAGGRGSAVLYATNEGNDWVVREFLDVAPDAAGQSLLPTIVHLIPESRLDCDLGEYTVIGSAGLGFVALGDTPAYHTQRDNPDVIDPGSIQQMGGYTLAALRHFGDLDLAAVPQDRDRVFFSVLPGVVVHYAATWVLPLAGLLTVAVTGLLVHGYRTDSITARGVTLGAATFLFGTLGAAILAALVWVMVRTLNTDYQVLLIGSYQSGLYTVAMILVTIAAVTSLLTLLTPRVGVRNLAAGALAGALVPLWVVSILVPGMSYLVLWPVAFAAIPLGWMLLAGERWPSPTVRLAALAIAVVPPALLLPGTLYAMTGFANRLEGLMNLPLLGIVAIFVAPPIGLLVLQLHALSGDAGWRRWIVPISAALIAVALIGWGNAASGYNADQPRPDRIAYVLNLDTAEAQWVSRDQHLDSWTGQFFPDGVGREDVESLMTGTGPAYVASAPDMPVMPAVVSTSSAIEGDIRTITVRMRSDTARIMAARITAPGEITELVVDGHPIDLDEFPWARAGGYPIVNPAMTADGWELTVSVRSHEPIILDIEEAWDGLPDGVFEEYDARPPDTMPAPDYVRDPTVVKRTLRV